MAIDIRINEALDAEALGEVFRERGRLQIPDFLASESADALYEAIQKNQDWYLAYNERGQSVESPMAEIQRLSPQQRQQLMQPIHQQASTGFQFCFIQYYLSEAVNRGENPGHPLHSAHEFVNSEPWLGFMRTLIGEPGLKNSDALASLYLPGHFLTEHDDTHHDRNRVAAYVINLTRDWNPNWGGHLAFFDDKGNIEQSFVPTFNTLNIFQVPQSHAVQVVAPFARSGRTSITGWVHR